MGSFLAAGVPGDKEGAVVELDDRRTMLHRHRRFGRNETAGEDLRAGNRTRGER